MQDLTGLPYGSDYNPPERIVCAANKYGDIIVAGIRHGCGIMVGVYDELEKLNYESVDYHSDGFYKDNFLSEEEQGFLTSKHRFVDRCEAWQIAVEQHQIVRRVGGDTKNGGTLYSENLY